MSEVRRYKFSIRDCDCVQRAHTEGRYAPVALNVEETKEECGWVKWYDHKDEVNRLKAENAKLRAENEWQPIETAPCDGQTILAYRHPHGAFILHQYQGNGPFGMTHWMPNFKTPIISPSTTIP